MDKLSSELESRLDEIFREDEPTPKGKPAASADYPLGELKKSVLSIDWEITPEALDGFLDQVRLLKEVYGGDPVPAMFLQILGSLGQYIKSSRSKVHPSTFSVLNSVFAGLDEVVSTPEMPAAARRRRLKTEMGAYQELRAKILGRRAADTATQTPVPAAAAESPAGGAVSPEALAKAVRELKEFIRAEIDRLREELGAGRRRP
jgi:hypothetical protein